MADQQSLPDYIGQLLKDYKKNRKPLEDKWNRNREAFLSIVTGHWKKDDGAGWRSQAFIQMTRQKVMSAFAIISDHLLQGGKFSFALSVAPETEKTLDEIDPTEREEIEAKVDNAEKHIQQQLLETKSDIALNKGIMACAMYGVTYAKRTFETVVTRTYQSILDTLGIDTSRVDMSGVEDTYTLVIDKHDSPGARYISNWTIYTDLEAGTFDPKKNRGTFHVELVSPAWLRSQAKESGYIREYVKEVIRSAQQKTNEAKDDSSITPALRELKYRHKTIEYAEYWGKAPKKLVEQFEESLKLLDEFKDKDIEDLNDIAQMLTGEADYQDDDDYKEAEEVEIMTCWADNKLVRFLRSSEDLRPFLETKWEDIVDENAGRGVADSVESMQESLNGSWRSMIDNKKLSGNVILGLKREFIENKFLDIVPGLIVELSAECDDARKAIQQITVQDVGSQMNEIIQACVRFAEEDSLIPRITQGFEAGGTQTAYETAQQVEKATKYMATVVRNFDDNYIEPLIKWMFDQNMLDENFKDKGNYIVKATGFSSYQDQIVAVQQIRNFMMFVLSNPATAPMLKVREALKALAEQSRLDSNLLIKTPQELARSEQQQNPMLLAQLEKIGAEIEKLRADAAAKMVGAQTGVAKTEIDQARAAKEFQETLAPPPPPAPPPQPRPPKARK